MTPSGRKRLFVAAEVPPSLRSELATYAGRHVMEGVRWLPPENLHLTVSFLGYVDGDLVDHIAAAVAAASAQHAQFPLTLARVAPAPPRGRPRMVWLFFEESPAFAALAAGVFDAVRQIAPQSDPPRPHPHLTLARFARGAAPRLELEPFQPADPTLQLDACVLFESRLGRDGAAYTALAHAPLAG